MKILKREVTTIINISQYDLMSEEFGNFICDYVEDKKLSILERTFKPISSDELLITIQGEEADVLRFQAYSSFEFKEAQ